MPDEPKPARTVVVTNALLIAVGAGMVAIACYGAVTSSPPSDAPKPADGPDTKSPVVAPVQPEPEPRPEPDPEPEWPKVVGDVGPDAATVMCSTVIDLLRDRCPDAGQLRAEDCTVTEDDSRYRGPRTLYGELGSGHYVGIGPKTEWFLAEEDGAVLTATDAAIHMCPTMDSIFVRMRARAREAAAKQEPGNPAVCSMPDIEQAELVASRIGKLPQGYAERDVERVFASVAKEKGATKKSVRATWEKVQKVCPQAL